jgi:hypothetical protein
MHQACLDPKAMLVSSHLALVDLRTPVALAPFEILIPAPRDLAHMQKMAIIKVVQCMG